MFAVILDYFVKGSNYVSWVLPFLKLLPMFCLFDGDNFFFLFCFACCSRLLLREFSMYIQKGEKNSCLNV